MIDAAKAKENSAEVHRAINSPPGQVRRRVYFLARALTIGGAERQLACLAAGLKRRGWDVSVAVFYGGGALEDDARAAGVQVIDLGKSGRWDVLGFIARLVRSLRAERPDVLYAFLGTSNMLAVLLRPLVPVKRVIWSVRASDMELERYGRAERWSYRAECALSGRPDLIIANSHAGRRHAVANGFPENRIEVVPNGIDTERFRPEPSVRAAQRAQWGLRDDEIAVGALARLDPMKDHPNFLRAAAIAARSEPRLRFLCVGEGPEDYTASLLRLRAELGLEDRVTFTGRSTDPVGALNGFDLYCSSSAFGEGFSNAIAEAMACGLPCLVTDVGDSRMLVADTGLVVQPRDAEALGAGMIALARQLPERTPARVRTRIVDNFSVPRMVEATERLLSTG